MNCPSCASPMTTFQYAGVTLDECLACKLVWFDRTEFAAVMEHDVPSTTIQWGKTVKDRASQALNCPRDRSPMKAMEWGGIPFDRCARCAGVLLPESSWAAAREAAEARAKGSKFSAVEMMRDLFNM